MLAKGTIVFPSELGHKNFLYPIFTKGFCLKADCKAKRLNYISGYEMIDEKVLTAFKVKDKVLWTYI